MGPSSARPVHILLVEDNLGDAMLIEALLRENAQKQFVPDIFVASDGEMAVDYLFHREIHAAAPTPEVILLDINMPKKNGFEVLTEIRQHSRLRKIPVFMLTTSDAPEDMVRSFSLDVVSFITKPSQLGEFESIIDQFMNFDLPRVLRVSDKERPWGLA